MRPSLVFWLHATTHERKGIDMYGLINEAIQGLVTENFGQEAWVKICAQAGLDHTEFVSMQQYPDSETYDLVGAASSVLGMSPELILETFGRYWVQYVGSQAYGELMDAAGTSLGEFLENLDHMHSRVMISYPSLRPPSFRVQSNSEHEIILHYISERPGLCPLVVGLLYGLADRFETRIEVDSLDGTEEGVTGIFKITLLTFNEKQS